MSLILYLTRIHFADRVLEDALAEEADRNRIRRPLVLTEGDAAGTARSHRLFDALPVTSDPTHIETDPETPAETDLRRASEALSEAECDGIVACGGGRAIGVARVLGRGDLPILAVPTTTETIGLGPVGPDLSPGPARRLPLPSAILCDPTLTTGLAPAATAAAGMAVLVHCLESYLSTTFNPPADGIALDGLRRAAGALERAVTDGADLDARRDLLAAALDAGLAAEKGFGGIEAATHGLESASRRPSGALRSALLAGVLAFNAPVIRHRFATICQTLGLPAGADPAGHLTALARRVGLPLSLSEAGIDDSVLTDAAARAAADPATRTNPRHATVADYEDLLHTAF